jgi:hypothetical protein
VYVHGVGVGVGVRMPIVADQLSGVVGDCLKRPGMPR